MLEASKQVYISLLQPLFDYTDVAWGGGDLRGVLQRVTPPTELCSYYIMEEHLKWHVPCA